MSVGAARAARPWSSLAGRAARRLAAEIRLTAAALWRGVVGIYTSNDLTFAASIAYYSLLSLFPFLLLVISILASVAGTDAERGALLAFVLRYFPRQFEFVTTQLETMQQARVQLGLAGSVLMVWAAMGVFGAITSAVNYAWGVEKQPSYFKHKLISFVMLAVSGMLLLAGLLLVSAVNVAQAGWFAGVLSKMPALMVLRSFALRWASLVIFIALVGLIFYFVPNASVRFRDVWMGAVVTGLLWQGALTGFSRYVRDLSRFSVHGSIAAVVVFLLWVYISAVILLYGVEVSAANARLRTGRSDDLSAAPAPRT